MATARTSHTCSHVTTTDGEDEIVVVGGYSGKSLKSVEIYSTSNMEWRSGIPRIDIKSEITNLIIITLQEMISQFQYMVMPLQNMGTLSSWVGDMAKDTTTQSICRGNIIKAKPYKIQIYLCFFCKATKKTPMIGSCFPWPYLAMSTPTSQWWLWATSVAEESKLHNYGACYSSSLPQGFEEDALENSQDGEPLL